MGKSEMPLTMVKNPTIADNKTPKIYAASSVVTKESDEMMFSRILMFSLRAKSIVSSQNPPTTYSSAGTTRMDRYCKNDSEDSWNRSPNVRGLPGRISGNVTRKLDNAWSTMAATKPHVSICTWKTDFVRNRSKPAMYVAIEWVTPRARRSSKYGPAKMASPRK